MAGVVATRRRRRRTISGGSDTPPRSQRHRLANLLGPGVSRLLGLDGLQEGTRAQKNPDVPCPRVKVPDSAYRVRGPGDRQDGVGERWRAVAHLLVLHEG